MIEEIISVKVTRTSRITRTARMNKERLNEHPQPEFEEGRTIAVNRSRHDHAIIAQLTA